MFWETESFLGEALAGAKQIAEYHAPPFATHLAGTELRFAPLQIRCICKDAYLVTCEGGIVREGRVEGALIGHSVQMFLVQRDEGRMQVSAFQNTRVRSIDGPDAAEVWKQFDESWARLSRGIQRPHSFVQ